MSGIVGHFRYLDNLRESGRTNMWGAGEYLRRERNLDVVTANRIVVQWMNTFDPSLSVEDRAAKVSVT
jgi:hypothetical protein